MSDIKKWMDIVAGAEALAANISNFQSGSTPQNSTAQATDGPKPSVNVNVSVDLGNGNSVSPTINVPTADISVGKPQVDTVVPAEYDSVQYNPANQQANNTSFNTNDTVLLTPKAGGGVGRFVSYTDNGAIVDIKGAHKEFMLGDIMSLTSPVNDISTNELVAGNTNYHVTDAPDTRGTMNDKPEFRPGDLVKVDDVYGSVIGPGFGVFIAYSTSGQECIVSFDNKTITVPTETVSAVLEQNAKDEFNKMDNDGNLSPISLGINNVKIKEDSMDHKSEFSKWMTAVEEALSGENNIIDEELLEQGEGECGCGSWDCPVCFPDDTQQTGQQIPAVLIIGAPQGQAQQTPQAAPAAQQVAPPAQQGVGMAGAHPVGDDTFDHSPEDEIDIPMMDPEEFDEEDETVETEQDTTPRSGSGVKLGHIVQKYVAHNKDGQESPMTHGSEIEEVTKPTKTKQDFSVNDYLDDLDNVKPSNIAQYDNNDDGEFNDTIDRPEATPTPAMPRASAATTRARTANMNPSELMRDMMSRISPDAGGDEPELANEPQDQTNAMVARTAADVPAVISSSMQAAGVATPEWHSVNNLPGYSQQNVRGMGRQIFGMFTSTPLEQIQTIANVDGQGPNTDAELRAVANWLRTNADDLGEVQLDHGRAIPGYRPDVKEYSINGVRFHVVRDPMGQYIYAYPDADARTNQGQGRLGQQGATTGQGRLRGNVPQLREDNSMVKLTITEAIKLDDIIRTGLKQLDEAFGKPTSAERDARKQAGFAARTAQHGMKRASAVAAGEPFNEPAPKAAPEKGTLARRVGSKPGGKALISWMHKEHKLSNEAEMEPVPFDKELLNSQFKSHPDDFVIVSASNGVAGIKPSAEHIKAATAAKAAKGETYNPGGDSSLPYQIVAFTDDGKRVDPTLLKPAQKSETQKVKQRMGKLRGSDMQNPDNIFNLLSRQIGTLRTVWISGWAGYRGDPESVKPATGSVERGKMASRAALKAPATSMDKNTALQTIFAKIRPVLSKLSHEALSPLMRARTRADADGNDDKVEKLTARIKKIKEFIMTLDTSREVNLANTPYYRDVVAALAKTGGMASYTPEFEEYVASIAQGGAAGFKPVLDAMRDEFFTNLR